MRLGKILLITGNPGKAEELRLLLPGASLEHRPLDLVEIQSLLPQEIGHAKALEALSKLSEEDHTTYDAVLTDDTSLSFDALGGFPGSLIKYCLDALGTDGLVALLSGKSNTAKAGCCLSLGLTATGEVVQFEGILEGRIQASSGTSGFGWDPIFYPEGYDQSFAGMGTPQKQAISHRSLAAADLLKWLGEPGS